jgi:hypothetical protein
MSDPIISEDSGTSGTVVFDLSRNEYLVSARVYSDLLENIIRAAVPPQQRHRFRSPRSGRLTQSWCIDASAAAGLADALLRAGYRVIVHGEPHLDVAPWAREIFQRCGAAHREDVFVSLLRVLDDTALPDLARAFEESQVA